MSRKMKRTMRSLVKRVLKLEQRPILRQRYSRQFQNVYNPVAEGRPDWVPGTAGNPAISLPGVECTIIGAMPLIANRLDYEPRYVVTPITLDQLLLEITVGAVGNVRLGIYRADVNWQPANLIVDAGQLNANVVGVGVLPINVQLTPGRYLFARNSDATPTVRVVRGGSRYAGFSSTMGANLFISRFRATVAYAPFADPGVAWINTGPAANPFIHAVFCRISIP